MMRILNSSFLVLMLILILGGFLRFISIYPTNTIIGFDQARDLFLATSIYEHYDLKIIGPTAGNNPNLHHGILYIYYLLPAMFFSHGNIMAVVFWNSLVNLLTVVVIYFLGRNLFDHKTGILSALFVSVSFFFIQFSGWLSNPSPTLFTVPLFFLGLWQIYLKNKSGFVIAAIGLGLSIQFELFFIYLIPVGILIWILLRIPFPKTKQLGISILVFLGITLTMIVTEFKYHFAGILAILSAGDYVGGEKSGSIFGKFLVKYFEIFSLNLLPSKESSGLVLTLVTLGFLFLKLVQTFRQKVSRDKYIFLLIYLLSPFIMLILGFHNAPWFLIGLPGAICLAFGYLLSQIRYTLVILVIIVLIIFSNSNALLASIGVGQKLLEPDVSALYSTQMSVLEYTYRKANGEPFLINTVTNPLYINALWAYHYNYFGERKYGYKPSWGGGEQLYPYDTLEKETNKESYFFIILDKSPRIGQSYRDEAIKWGNDKGVFISEQDFGGWKVMFFKR